MFAASFLMVGKAWMGAEEDEFVITGLGIPRCGELYCQEVERVCAKCWADYELQSPPMLSLFSSHAPLSIAST